MELFRRGNITTDDLRKVLNGLDIPDGSTEPFKQHLMKNSRVFFFAGKYRAPQYSHSPVTKSIFEGVAVPTYSKRQNGRLQSGRGPESITVTKRNKEGSGGDGSVSPELGEQAS